MSILNQTHEQIHGRLYGISSLGDSQRKEIAKAIHDLNQKGDWHPEAMQRTMKQLQAKGHLSDFERHAISKEFFPGHS